MAQPTLSAAPLCSCSFRLWLGANSGRRAIKNHGKTVFSGVNQGGQSHFKDGKKLRNLNDSIK